MDIKLVESKIKEIKSFVIKQMKDPNTDWCKRYGDELESKYISIDKRNYVKIKSEGIEVNISEINISRLRFFFLRKIAVNTAKLEESKDRRAEIANKWNRFANQNKNIMRDSKLDKILNS